MAELDFEARLGGQLRTYADGGIRPIDRRAIAIAVVAGGSQRRIASRLGRERWSARPSRRTVLILVTALSLGAVAGGALLLGAGHPPTPLPSATPIPLSTSSPPPSSSLTPRAQGVHTFAITRESAPCPVPGGGTTNLISATVVDFRAHTTRTLPECLSDLLLSPDGLHAVAVGAKGLELIDLKDGTSRPIPGGTGPDVQPMAWSPRGTYLDWVASNTVGTPAQVFVGPVTDIRRGRPPQSADGGVFVGAMWSADERRALFPSSDGWRFVIGNGDATGLQALPEQGVRVFAISPDGGRIAVAIERKNLAGSVVAVDVAEGDGFSPPRIVTHFPDGTRALDAGWSPDGSTLAVVSASLGDSATPTAPTSNDLWLNAVDGTQRRIRLPSADDPVASSSLVWAGDGAHLAVGWHTVRRDAQGLETHTESFVIASARDGGLAEGDQWTPGSINQVFFSPDGSHFVNLANRTPEVEYLDGSGSVSLAGLLPDSYSTAQFVWIP